MNTDDDKFMATDSRRVTVEGVSMANSELEARILENGRLHTVKSFVYYFPECFLVVKVADYTGKMIKDPKQIEFHIKAPGADFRSIPVKGIRYE